jgi:Protein of unknown function (DUF3800)
LLNRLQLDDPISALWWLMHHSCDPDRLTMVLAHYIDDSGSHDESPRVVMGGPVFLQKDFYSLHYEWDRIVALHRVQGPIHMKEFARPNGRLAYLTDDERRAIFSDLVYLINTQKAWSLTIEVDHLEFQQFFPLKEYRGLFGAVPLAFIWGMVLNGSIMRTLDAKYRKMAYMVAKSSDNPSIVDSHSFMQSYEENAGLDHTGSLTFETPRGINALQAADMVAWANRRKCVGMGFTQGYEPLELLTRNVQSDVKGIWHFHKVVESEDTRKLAEILGDPVRESGRRIAFLTPVDWKPKVVEAQEQ